MLAGSKRGCSRRRSFGISASNGRSQLANALGVESLGPVFSELVGYVPSVIAAVVIVILGIVLGDFVGGLIMGVGFVLATTTSPEVVPA